MDLKNVLEKKLKEVKPSLKEEELISEFVKDFIKKLGSALKKYGAEAVLGGSFSKGTAIRKGKYDVDVFVVFPKGGAKSSISDLLGSAIKKTGFKAQRLPGSRDYFSITVKKYWAEFKVEVVPVVKIKSSSEAENVTDVSVLHVKYIKGEIKKNKRLSDEIRLAKAFCYAQDVYGAESHIRGFSGYCLEVLTTHYGGFVNLIKAASKWPDKVVLDPESYYKDKKYVLEELNEAKLMSPLVLVDPVQKNRNVAAALSAEKFDKFKKACKDFLRSPSEKFFDKKEFDEGKLVEEAKRKKIQLFKVNAFSDKVKEDISGAKLLKLHGMLILELEKRGYSVRGQWTFANKRASSYILILKSPGKVLHKGPSVKMEVHAAAFKKRWRKTFEKNGWLFAEITPPSPEDVLKIDKSLLEEMSIDSYSIEEMN